jgi:hypothetical protein
MKTSLIILTCIMALSAGAYDESNQLLDKIMVLGDGAKSAYQKAGMEIVKIDVDLVGKGLPKQVVKKFSGDFKYTIFCIGDPTRIKDIAIKVLYINPTGGTVKISEDDKGNGPSVIVPLYNPTPGDYIIVIDAPEMQPGIGMGYFYLLIAHD